MGFLSRENAHSTRSIVVNEIYLWKNRKAIRRRKKKRRKKNEEEEEDNNSYFVFVFLYAENEYMHT
jgi:hypothetical protein